MVEEEKEIDTPGKASIYRELTCRHLPPVDTTVWGNSKSMGTDKASEHPGTNSKDITVPGDGGNDTFTSKYAVIGTVTGNVEFYAKVAVDHAIILADEDGTVNVPKYPGPTQRRPDKRKTNVESTSTRDFKSRPPTLPTNPRDVKTPTHPPPTCPPPRPSDLPP